jgi:hypothetical protein
MVKEAYKRQVALLLNVIPEIAKESCFALHGGTAINLFVRDMPRLSIDVDLTYIPIEDRTTSLQNISEALERAKKHIEKAVPHVTVLHRNTVARKVFIVDQKHQQWHFVQSHASISIPVFNISLTRG